MAVAMGLAMRLVPGGGPSLAGLPGPFVDGVARIALGGAAGAVVYVAAAALLGLREVSALLGLLRRRLLRRA
jgi:hypothetical protein